MLCFAITSSQCHCYYVYGVNGCNSDWRTFRDVYWATNSLVYVLSFFIASIGLVGLIASYFFSSQKNLPIPGKVDLKRNHADFFTNKPLVFSFLITAFGYGGTFVCIYVLVTVIGKNLGFFSQCGSDYFSCLWRNGRNWQYSRWSLGK